MRRRPRTETRYRRWERCGAAAPWLALAADDPSGRFPWTRQPPGGLRTGHLVRWSRPATVAAAPGGDHREGFLLRDDLGTAAGRACGRLSGPVNRGLPARMRAARP